MPADRPTPPHVDDVDRTWWKEAVFYQCYPQSFADSDGDGVGDLPGVVDRLDYLDALGVDGVWLNPVYASPGVDNGYDVADYRAIRDAFGDMRDWERLRDGLHDRGVRLVMDLVLNHTSDAHEWFERSRRGEPPYDEFYYWRDAEGDAPPNDWRSFFGGPAWSRDEERGAWYLHLFDPRQPDLNWSNPDIREAVYDVVAWWLDRGVDGFRLDVVNVLSKPDGLPDGDPDHDGIVHGADKFVDGPRVHEYVGELHDHVGEAMTVGEAVDGLTVAEARRYAADGLSMTFTFDHVHVDVGDDRWSAREWTLPEFKRAVGRWQTALAGPGPGWNGLFLENHDEPRAVSRFGDDGDEASRRASAKCLGTLLLTLGGTPFVYQGQEIGMTNYPFASLDEVEDVDTLRNVREAIESGHVADETAALDLVRRRSRDNARTPMQWTDDPNAGFTAPDADPWLPVNPDHERVNVERARADPDSVWHHYRDLIDLRHDTDVLVYGDYADRLPDHDSLFVYDRRLRGVDPAHVLVALNLSATATRFDPPADLDGRAARRLVATDAEPGATTLSSATLAPWASRVWAVEG